MSQTFWKGLKAFRYALKCDHFIRCQFNQEMLLPTNSQKLLFDSNMDSMELQGTSSYSSQPVHFGSTEA